MSIYTGSLTREQFLFREARIIARLVLQNKDDHEIANEVYEDNLFQYPTERMVHDIVRVVLKRVHGLENVNLLEQLAKGPLELAKQINLYAIMRTNRLVKDFMIEVLGTKFKTQDFSISRRDVNAFFTHLKEQDEHVNHWSENTIKKLKQVLIKFLIEVEFILSIDEEVLHVIYSYPELTEAIKVNQDQDMLIVFSGGR